MDFLIKCITGEAGDAVGSTPVLVHFYINTPCTMSFLYSLRLSRGSYSIPSPPKSATDMHILTHIHTSIHTYVYTFMYACCMHPCIHMVPLKGNVALARNYFAPLSKTRHSSLDNLVYACA